MSENNHLQVVKFVTLAFALFFVVYFIAKNAESGSTVAGSLAFCVATHVSIVIAARIADFNRENCVQLKFQR